MILTIILILVLMLIIILMIILILILIRILILVLILILTLVVILTYIMILIIGSWADVDWIVLGGERDRRRAVVSTVMNIRVEKCGKFLD